MKKVMDQGRLSKSDLNRSAILAQLGIAGAASRTDLARLLNLSPALITQLTRDLVSDGLIRETRTLSSSGGRPATLLGLSSEAGTTIGIKVVADHLTFVAMATDGAILMSSTVDFNSSASSILEDLAEKTASFISDSKSSVILGIGVAVPGAVRDSNTGSVDSVTLGWQGIPLGATLARTLSLPVVVENNVNAVAVAEQLYGTGRNFQNFLVVTIGTGIGLSIVIEGDLYRGSRGAAGELGHIEIDPEGPICNCGKKGCLEAVIGQTSLEAAGNDKGLISGEENVGNLANIGRAGNAAAQEIFQTAARHLGTAVSNLVNIFDPEAILVLGEGVSQWDLWSSEFLTTLRSKSLPGALGIPVVVEHWNDASWAQGAASLVLSASRSTNSDIGVQASKIRRRFVAAGVSK